MSPKRMTAEELEFWRKLLAPFADHELSTVPGRGGRKKLTYVDKRALENRLNNVVGPAGWRVEYEATRRGYKCRLHLYVPIGNGEWGWRWKEDGAGFEEMGSYNKQSNEWVADIDNDEKSGYTNAFRRAAQDPWGIGRYLYRKGVPSFLDPNAKSVDSRPARNCSSQEPKQGESPGQKPTSRTIQRTPRTYDIFTIPRHGRFVFAWAKEIERHFSTSLIPWMRRCASQAGYDTDFFGWNANQVKNVCTELIGFIRTLPNYEGEFEDKGIDFTTEALLFDLSEYDRPSG